MVFNSRLRDHGKEIMAISKLFLQLLMITLEYLITQLIELSLQYNWINIITLLSRTQPLKVQRAEKNYQPKKRLVVSGSCSGPDDEPNNLFRLSEEGP